MRNVNRFPCLPCEGTGMVEDNPEGIGEGFDYTNFNRRTSPCRPCMGTGKVTKKEFFIQVEIDTEHENLELVELYENAK